MFVICETIWFKMCTEAGMTHTLNYNRFHVEIYTYTT